MSDALAWLLDRRAIDDLVRRYALACDRRQADVLRKVFASDATAIYFGDDRLHGRVEIVRWLMERTADVVHSQHLMSPYWVEIEGDRAHVVAQLTSRQIVSARPDEVVARWATYDLALARVGGQWQIESLTRQVYPPTLHPRAG